MSVEIFNRTKYNEEVLKEAAEFAHRVCGIEGDVAVIFRYHSYSSGYLGLMHPNHPLAYEIGGRMKKFAHNRYEITAPSRWGGYFNFTSATKDGAFGYITVRMPRAQSRLTKCDAKRVMETILHEMYHIKQYRNKVWALKDMDCKSWNEFIGYIGGRVARRVKHQSRPIEKHVNNLLKDLQPTLDSSYDYELIIDSMVNEFTSESVIKKAKKQKQTVKYNKWGERMSDYRNVKMKTLRSGDKIVTCPHCGEQAVNLNGDLDTFTHISAVSDEVVRYGGYSAHEARYTQYGHMTYHNGGFAVIEFGYANSTGEVSESALKSYNRKGYYG